MKQFYNWKKRIGLFQWNWDAINLSYIMHRYTVECSLIKFNYEYKGCTEQGENVGNSPPPLSLNVRSQSVRFDQLT